jgi:hypothetical protein
MRRELWPVVMAFLIGAGCPSEFMQGGRIDQAMAKDLREELGDCPVGQHLVRPGPECQGERCRYECVDDDEVDDH